MNDTTNIADIRRSDTERLRVNVKSYRGREYVELRFWFCNKAGIWCPSEKGISLSPGMIPELLQGLSLACRAVDAQGAR